MGISILAPLFTARPPEPKKARTEGGRAAQTVFSHTPSQLPAVIDDTLVRGGAGLAALSLEQLHHVHSLDDLAEDNVPPAQTSQHLAGR